MNERENAPILLVQALFLGLWQAYQGFWELNPSGLRGAPLPIQTIAI